MIAPEWARVLHKLAYFFPLETPVIPMGVEQSTQQSIYTPSALQIVLLCVHAPRGLFCPTHLPSATETSILLHFLACAEIIFAHILVSSRVP